MYLEVSGVFVMKYKVIEFFFGSYDLKEESI